MPLGELLLVIRMCPPVRVVVLPHGELGLDPIQLPRQAFAGLRASVNSLEMARCASRSCFIVASFSASTRARPRSSSGRSRPAAAFLVIRAPSNPRRA